VPCYNEAETLASVLSRVPKQIAGVNAIDTLLIDDGSSDGSAEIARRLGAQVLQHPHNMGVGAAFHSGRAHMLEQGYDYMVWLDADGQFDPRDIPDLLRPLLEDEADMATASRFLDSSITPIMPKEKRYGNWFFAKLVSLLSGQPLADVSCGFRAYSRRALQQIRLDGRFTYTQESIMELCFRGLRISEVPLVVRYFTTRRSRVAGNVVIYGLRALAIILNCYRRHFPRRFYAASALILALFAVVTDLIEPNLWSQPFATPFTAVLSSLELIAALVGGVCAAKAMTHTFGGAKTADGKRAA
jgi:glycosyltransferase involved in cell wall biosynthesis